MLYTRDRTETAVDRLAGPDGRLRGVPRPQVRPALAAQEFYALSAFFNNTTQAAMDGNIKDTPPVHLRADGSGPRALGCAAEANSPQASSSSTHRQRQAAAPRVRRLAGNGRAGRDHAATRRSPPPALHARLNEGASQCEARTRRQSSRDAELADSVTWEAGHVRQTRGDQRPTATSLEIADAGDFDRTSRSPSALWVKLARHGMTGTSSLAMR